MRQRFSQRMRLVSGLLTLAMVFTFLPFSALADSGIDGLGARKILPHNFPNATFMEYVKRFDTNNNEFLESEEREAVTEIDVHAKSIDSLKGIEFFPNLVKLECSNNKLTELDVSKNTKLTELYCIGNWQLSELDVSKNTALKQLWCGSCNLSSLRLGANTELEVLDCSQNQLSYLSTYNNSKLWYLDCSRNNLKSDSDLVIAYNKNLKELRCSDNQLERLSVKENTLLEKLYCKNNKLTYLDLKSNPNLTAGNVDVNGNAVPIKAGVITRTFFLKDLPVGYRSSRTKNWRNGSLNGDILTVDPGATEVLYDFDCGNGITKTFALQVEWVQDGLKIDETNFPDEVFRNYLLNAKFYESTIKFDKDGNGFFSEEERNAITSIDLFYGYNGEKVASLDGIEHFPNLESLTCSYNNLTSLDVSKNPALDWLNCMDNKLTSLDVSKNEKLETLACDTNQLSSLDVSQNVALKELHCTNNLLTSLDVSKNKKLDELWCSKNNLTSLDVSKNPVLDWLKCEQNNLSSLDVSKNAVLRRLTCSQNNLSSLDVSQNAVLKYLDCQNNQLTSLNVENTSIDLSDYLSGFETQNNTYLIAVETTPRTFDLSTLPGFDASKASGWVGGTVDGSTLKVDEGATQVTYTYDCGKGLSRDFTLNVNVVPDSTVTPPSGGDGTGTTTPPSGGDGTGTTTPPSGGGTGTTTPPSGGGTGTTTPPSGGGTGTTTPPSGGGTGTTTPPSGGGTGTTTPPSGGGTGTTTPPSGGGTGTTTPPSGGGTGTTTPPSGGGTGTTTPPSGGGGGGAALAVLAVGGTALVGLAGYGVYNYVSEQQLKAILPEGTAVPENRAQTALLLWNTAGRPEPAAAPAFADVADPDTAKAAQWCVEQNLLQTRRDGAFAPDSSLPVYKTLNVYRQLTGK